MSMISRRPTECSSSPTVAGNDLHRTTFDIGTDNVIAQNIGFLGNDKGINIDCERNFALDLDAGAFLRMHDFTADNFAFDKIHALCTFKCSLLLQWAWVRGRTW